MMIEKNLFNGESCLRYCVVSRKRPHYQLKIQYSSQNKEQCGLIVKNAKEVSLEKKERKIAVNANLGGYILGTDVYVLNVLCEDDFLKLNVVQVKNNKKSLVHINLVQAHVSQRIKRVIRQPEIKNAEIKEKKILKLEKTKNINNEPKKKNAQRKSDDITWHIFNAIDENIKNILKKQYLNEVFSKVEIEKKLCFLQKEAITTKAQRRKTDISWEIFDVVEVEAQNILEKYYLDKTFSRLEVEKKLHFLQKQTILFNNKISTISSTEGCENE